MHGFSTSSIDGRWCFLLMLFRARTFVATNRASFYPAKGDYGNVGEGEGCVYFVPAGAHIFASSMKYTHRPVCEGQPEGEITPAGFCSRAEERFQKTTTKSREYKTEHYVGQEDSTALGM